MKHLCILLIIFALYSCENRKSKIESIDKKNLTEDQVDSILTDFRFEYETPIVLDSSDFVLIPISTNLLDRRSSYSREGYYEDDFPRYWNILFYNRKTENTNLLTKEKCRISRIHTGITDGEIRSESFASKIVYELSNIDYNKDGKLDAEDPEYLFVSEIDGTNLRRISPVNEDLKHFKTISKTNQILIKTLRDINNDSIFDIKKDEFIWYKAELKEQNWRITEIADSLKRAQIERLYFEQWLLKKDN